MEEEIKDLLNCGYYDECKNYIVELNEEKMKDFFRKFFKADTVIFANKDYEKIKTENMNLNEKFDYMIETHRKECEEMKHYIDKMSLEADERLYKLREEHEKRCYELRQCGRDMIRAFAMYL